jgi:hypothetical protein
MRPECLVPAGDSNGGTTLLRRHSKLIVEGKEAFDALAIVQERLWAVAEINGPDSLANSHAQYRRALYGTLFA